MRKGFRGFARGVALATLLGGAQSAQGASFNVSGPPLNEIDGNSGSGVEVSLNSFVGGHISRDIDEVSVQITIETDAVHADNLQIFVVHNGIEVELYNGQGDDPISQVIATFSMSGEEMAPTTGSVSGTVLPLQSLDVFRGQDLSGIWTLRFVDALGNFDDTNLLSWVLTGNIEEGGPSRSVALFFNGTYVDTVDQPGDAFGFADAEALNWRDLLTFLKHDVETFTGITASDFATVLAGKDALVIPSLEGPALAGQPLHPALDEAARDEIRNFVTAGGLFITTSTFWSHNASLVSELFFGGKCTFIPFQPTGPPSPPNCVYSSNDSITGTLEDGAVGTPFQGGPGSLSSNIISKGLMNLPPEAEVAYTGNLTGFGIGNAVVRIPYPADGSGGAIIWMSNDFFNSIPEGGLDGGWPGIVDRAITDDLAPFLSPQNVALLNNSAYVDAVNDAANLEVSLVALGHNVQTFTDISLAGVNTALAGTDVLVIPDLEVDNVAPMGRPDFVDALDPTAQEAIFDFVNAGGILITHAATAEIFLEEFLELDPLFMGENAVDLEAFAGEESQGSPVGGTVFQQPTLGLENNTNTDLFSGFPAPKEGGGRAFVVGTTNTAVGLFRVGAGQVIWMGWDWEDGTQDGGWVDTLGRAVSAAGPLPIPEPGAVGCLGAALGALVGLSRRRSKRR